jgi:hypothetical protein
MKNVVFWDTEPQFVLHRGHNTSPLQSSFKDLIRATRCNIPEDAILLYVSVVFPAI